MITQKQNRASAGSWIPVHGAVMGRKHYRKNIPCQDACYASNSPRPYIIACDGRGSAEKSHFGAQEAVESIRRQMTVSHFLLSTLLDNENSEQSEHLFEMLKDQFFRAAAVVQKELAEKHSVSPKEFEFTLILFILGQKQSFYFHIGDGSLVIEQDNETIVLSKASNGEFANVTDFVQYGKGYNARAGLIDSLNITGAAAFSDGTAEKMIQFGTGLPSPGFAQMWKGMRERSFIQKDVIEFLTSTEWEPKVQDDRCLALISLTLENRGTVNTPEVKEETEKDTSVSVASPREPRPRNRIHNMNKKSRNFYNSVKKRRNGILPTLIVPCLLAGVIGYQVLIIYKLAVIEELTQSQRIHNITNIRTIKKYQVIKRQTEKTSGDEHIEKKNKNITEKTTPSAQKPDTSDKNIVTKPKDDSNTDKPNPVLNDKAHSGSASHFDDSVP